MTQPTEDQLARIANEIGARLHPVCADMPDDAFRDMCLSMAAVQWNSEQKWRQEFSDALLRGAGQD
jgi:predicted secreted protein